MRNRPEKITMEATRSTPHITRDYKKFTYVGDLPGDLYKLFLNHYIKQCDPWDIISLSRTCHRLQDQLRFELNNFFDMPVRAGFITRCSIDCNIYIEGYKDSNTSDNKILSRLFM